MPTNTYNCCQSYDNYKKNNRMEGTNPREIKGWVAKWQHAFGMPFRDAATVNADTGRMVRTVFTRKRQYDLRPL